MKTDTTLADDLRGDILRTVAYFDLFDYPVTAAQIYRFLPRNSVTSDHVAAVSATMAEDGMLVSADGLYRLPDRDLSIVRNRREGEENVPHLVRRARTVAWWIRRFPFVRAVMLTGSLSKDVAVPEGDIDFMIVTADDRLWITRTLLTMFRKIFLLGDKTFFCTNFYIAESSLTIHRRNLYTAVEVVTTKPLWNARLCNEFHRANGWTKEFLPNNDHAMPSVGTDTVRFSVVQRVMEMLLRILPLSRLDRRLMEWHRSHWMNLHPHLTQERLNSMYIIRPDASASWPEDRQAPVLTRYRERIAGLGLR